MRIVFVCLSIAVLFANCNNGVKSTEEVKALDALLIEVAKAESEFLELPHKEIKSKLDSIKSTIAFVEANYGGEMNKGDALLLDNLRGTKSIVKRFGDRTHQMEVEFTRTKNQLTNFRDALSSGATHDKNNQEITAVYIKNNMKLERDAAENLITSVNELKSRSERFIEQYEEKLQAIRPYLNSLK